MSEMDDIIKEFLVESNDNLDQLDSGLVELEKDPQSQELLGGVFRAIHTVKGTSGVLGFSKLESIAHGGENLLSKLRDGKLRLNTDITSGLLKMVDAIREVLRAIESTGSEGDGNYTEITSMLSSLLDRELANATLLTGEPRRLGQILTENLSIPQDAIDAALSQQSAGDLRRIGEILVEQGTIEPQEVLHALKTQAGETSTQVSASNIRVDVGLLDKLMNLVGELVLTRNQILQVTASQKDASFVGAAQRLNLITTELQEGVMKTRMQPIGNVWNKFPRVVRDLSVQFGKAVRIEMEGTETELDKTIIEAIKDPLTHIIRNAVDHGIEMPETRRAQGKPPEGKLLLRAFHEGGQVNIEISDDGGGIDLERLKKKAIERAQVTGEQAARMSEREALNLVFLPGLSTAEKVTNVSGRGVGMDVVKTNVEKIGGVVDIHSVPRQGTTLKIKIPLTLAIIPALIATSGGERFAIPQVSLLELVRLEGAEASTAIEDIHGAPVYRLRGKLLPLVFLNQALRLANSGSAGFRPAESFQFDAARISHLAWKDKLRNYLDGQGEISPQTAESPRDCALGQWLYGSAFKQYSHIPEIQRLEERHREMHAMVGSVIRSHQAKNNAAADERYSQIEPISREIVKLLLNLEKQLEKLFSINIVVLQADEHQFGLVVDEINDTEEIVVKPLGKQLKGIDCFAGATIMGDGQVALILDVLGIAQTANVVTEVRDHAVIETAIQKTDRVAGRDAWLVFTAGGRRMAIPLGMVARLEEFSASQMEYSGDGLVVQYRGQIMPLIDIARRLNLDPGREPEGTLQVVVYSEAGRSIGLVVEQIVDVVEQAVSVECVQGSCGLMGSAVLQEKVTDLLDVRTLVQQVPGREIRA